MISDSPASTRDALVPGGGTDLVAVPAVVGWREVYHDGDVDVLAVHLEEGGSSREALALRTGAAPVLTPQSARALGAFLLDWADRSVAEEVLMMADSRAPKNTICITSGILVITKVGSSRW